MRYQTFTPPDLSVRSAAQGGDGRTIYGIAVPWDYPVRIDDDLNEEFASGSFAHQERAANRVTLQREHVELGGTIIGPTRMIRNDAAGLYFEARASKTPAGDETLELVRDGALRQVSIAFNERPRGQVMRSDPALGRVVRRTKADLFGIAVVREGAYGDGAQAIGTRSRVGELLDEAGTTTYIDLATPNLDKIRALEPLPALPLPTV